MKKKTWIKVHKNDPTYTVFDSISPKFIGGRAICECWNERDAKWIAKLIKEDRKRSGKP